MAIVLTRAPRPATGLFPTFLAAGFECASTINSRGVRIDELIQTGHDHVVRKDYARLRQIGIRTVRDGVRWNLVDRAGELDFSTVLPYLDAARREGMTVIWDLFHYGYPEDLDPFDGGAFVQRFARYCAAFARLLVQRGRAYAGPYRPAARFYTPVNEPSFFAWAGGEVGMFAPFETGRGAELKARLAEAQIAGIDAIREIDPRARFVHCDPIVRVTAPADAPWLQAEADHFNATYVTESLDMLCGRAMPELGGHPRYLDVLGVNYYGVNQWEYGRPGNVLCEDDPRRAPFGDLLIELHHRYRRPIFVSETASCGPDRPRWLLRMAQECERALEHGVELHGMCVYPVLGMADWETAEYRDMGLWDIPEDDPTCRIACSPAMRAVSRIQEQFAPAEETAARLAPEPQLALELSA